jgi:hypothetical protein
MYRERTRTRVEAVNYYFSPHLKIKVAASGKTVSWSQNIPSI